MPDKAELAGQLPTYLQTLKLSENFSPDRFLTFYQEYAPELLQEWHQVCLNSPETASQHLQQLVLGYEELQALKQSNPSVYAWRAKRFQQELKTRLLAKEIKKLDAELQNKSVTEQTDKFLQLHQNKQKLKKMLEDDFQARQQEQQIEMKRLETEMNMLKMLLEEREANKDNIIQEKYRKLTNLDW
ncbi:MAG: hypothetical protein GX946_02205 [Oligosphaeraceae bacterium]|nr:hypothetical protein [Oligosphaeraceae bacterium]